jgi:hypothetical protein
LKRTIVPALAAVAAAAAAVPASAAAADVVPDLPCYLPGAPLELGGSGWTPGATWTASGAVSATTTVDAQGLVAAGGLSAPTITAMRRTPQTFTVDATDGAQTAGATFQVVNPGAIWNDDGDPRGRVKWTFGGLAPGEPVYVHVRRGLKTLKTTKVGRASTPCGTASKRLRRLPLRSSQITNGNYKIAVDNRKRFSSGGLQYVYPYKVSTRIRTR